MSEDGSSKVYSIAVSKLSSRAVELSDLTIEGGHDLQLPTTTRVSHFRQLLRPNSHTIRPK